jgi:DNA adenine methylase
MTLPVNEILLGDCLARPDGGLKAPFPWFGGKSAVAPLVWERFGDVPNYVEPFFGSGAVLLGRPVDHVGNCETINDKDGYVANFWRAVTAEPAAVAGWADQPVNENDLHARHIWLVNQRDSFVPRLEGDPKFYDAKIAGWWVWGVCCWIGHGFCSGQGPWHVVDGQLVHLGDKGQGVNRKRVLITNDGIGCTRRSGGVYEWFEMLATRLRGVRVCCGDWQRVCGPTPTIKQGLTGVFLDPPYGVATRSDCYTEDCRELAHAVRDWAVGHGDDPLLRIGGYGSQSKNGNDNCRRERIWFSPTCLKPEKRNRQMDLFERD